LADRYLPTRPPGLCSRGIGGFGAPVQAGQGRRHTRYWLRKKVRKMFKTYLVKGKYGITRII